MGLFFLPAMAVFGLFAFALVACVKEIRAYRADMRHLRVIGRTRDTFREKSENQELLAHAWHIVINRPGRDVVLAAEDILANYQSN